MPRKRKMPHLPSLTLMEQLDARSRKRNQGNWIPASGGTEEPFMSRSGHRLQYLYQPSTGRHAYIDLGTDIILSDEEAQRLLGI